MATEKKPISIKGVLQDLTDGLDRPAIAAKYGITLAEAKQLFQHPALLGKKTRKPMTFTIIDDAPPPIEKKPKIPRKPKDEGAIASASNGASEAPTLQLQAEAVAEAEEQKPKAAEAAPAAASQDPVEVKKGLW